MIVVHVTDLITTHSVADCGELSDPENGVVTYASTVYLSQARYSCNEGYELSQTGSILRICRANGQWTSFPPQCNRKINIT